MPLHFFFLIFCFSAENAYYASPVLLSDIGGACMRVCMNVHECLQVSLCALACMCVCMRVYVYIMHVCSVSVAAHV